MYLQSCYGRSASMISILKDDSLKKEKEEGECLMRNEEEPNEIEFIQIKNKRHAQERKSWCV